MPDETEPVILPLREETLRVKRRRRVTARVRVSRHTAQRTEVIDLPLARETVEVTRVPVGAVVDAAPPVREQDGATVFSVVEEILVVERRLLLKEEVHVRRVATTRHHREEVVLQTQTVTVERTPAQEEPLAEARVGMTTGE